MTNMTTTVNVAAAKAQLSSLLARAAAGEDIVIARDGRPLVRLQPVGEIPARQLGFVPVTIPATFFEPLSPAELDAWG